MHTFNLFSIFAQKQIVMKNSETIDYDRIAKAIQYINQHFKQQPNLDEVAQHLHLSSAHFQRIFTQWAGTSPKKFLKYTSVEYAKWLLKEKQATLFDTAEALGLSSTSRLHDLFISIEGMTPAEYKNEGKGLIIYYHFFETLFGLVLIANTNKGICYMVFVEDNKNALDHLFQQFKQATFIKEKHQRQLDALQIFDQKKANLNSIKLHLKGTDFQLKVWNSLLTIPEGNLVTYSTIANSIDNPKAWRAVGTAIGSNPVAFLIPCHRVIQSTGNFGNYMWGSLRKEIIIGWEGVQTHESESF